MSSAPVVDVEAEIYKVVDGVKVVEVREAMEARLIWANNYVSANEENREHVLKIKALEDRITSLTNEIAILHSNATTDATTISGKENEIRVLTQERTTLQGEITKRDEKIAALDVERETLRNSVAKITGERDSLESGKAILTAEKDALVTQCGELTAKVDDFAKLDTTKKLAALELDNAKLSQDVQILRSQLGMVTKETTARDAAIKKIADAINSAHKLSISADDCGKALVSALDALAINMGYENFILLISSSSAGIKTSAHVPVSSSVPVPLPSPAPMPAPVVKPAPTRVKYVMTNPSDQAKKIAGKLSFFDKMLGDFGTMTWCTAFRDKYNLDTPHQVCVDDVEYLINFSRN